MLVCGLVGTCKDEPTTQAQALERVGGSAEPVWMSQWPSILMGCRAQYVKVFHFADWN